jgi:hypothetical protein
MQRARTLVLSAVMLGLSACQSPDQPGPFGRAGAQIDHTVADTQRSLGDFSVRAADGVNQAGRAVGTSAQRVGSSVHDWLSPSDDRSPDKFSPDLSPVPGP